MKKTLITVLASWFIPLMMVSQLSVTPPTTNLKPFIIGQAKSGMSVVAELSYTFSDSDTTYALSYFNWESRTDNSVVKFKGTSTIGVLYNLLNAFFLPENEKNKEFKADFKLGETNVFCSSYRAMGVTSVKFATENKGYFMLTRKQLDKLFGK